MHRSRTLGAPWPQLSPRNVGGQRDVPERARVRVEEPTEPVETVVSPPAADSKPAAVD